jgi:hypothetical protein
VGKFIVHGLWFMAEEFMVHGSRSMVVGIAEDSVLFEVGSSHGEENRF